MSDTGASTSTKQRIKCLARAMIKNISVSPDLTLSEKFYMNNVNIFKELFDKL